MEMKGFNTCFVQIRVRIAFPKKEQPSMKMGMFELGFRRY
jgi:hypothetical protein